ncbi:MAG: radical SAM protein [Pseudomonadota bacterium]
MDEYLTAKDVAAWPVASENELDRDLKKPLRDALKRAGLASPLQVAGNHFAMGCVALEITQRCNLDCTACYLSDMSEAVHDLPLEEVFRRIDLIAAHYGPNTNVQVTGGDPTLRDRDELIAIITRLSEKNLRAALFTNGIRATRSLLTDLAKAGLKDVAFHIDMTQKRKGFESEEDLNTLRDDYIARAEGLGLQILFNTTVFEGNIADIPALARFFTRRADKVHLASFQMIADTGRGVDRERTTAITQARVMDLISEGAGTPLGFDFPQIGHLECNRYAKCLVAGDDRTTAFSEEDRAFFERLLPFSKTLFLDRRRPVTSFFRLASKVSLGDLKLFALGTAYVARKAWRLRRGLVRGFMRSGRSAHLITFYVHNFMHAHQLKRERCETCVFMTMTRDGPVSMCVHNAKRNTFILQDIDLSNGNRWNPLGDETMTAASLPLKRLKGRARRERTSKRQTNTAKVDGVIGAIETARRKTARTAKSL